MFKLTLVLAVIAGLACATPSRPTGDEYRAELVKAGLSTPAIDGILKISGDAYTEFSTKYGKCPNFQDAIENVTRLILNLEKFMKTQTKEDQEKYMAYVEEKKKEFDN
ncbi:hypothetical protein CAEBREN_03472 [Caenorhabditis brenneri]|uniref:Uncharacterized protein n=1 Tax=Caenorhabditis brenneri TaxID=135651 RepID=G0N123_CAEBE|nr:hypothetical protein CAEBREN_03472 [Caenorhabditis brenneri]